MTDKPPRKHNPAWADNTRAERQARRRAALDEIARAVGYDTWRKLETAAINGEVKVVPVVAGGTIEFWVDENDQWHVEERPVSEPARGE